MTIRQKIQELKDRYDQRRNDREERRKLLEPFVDRLNEIRGAPRATKSDFFCDKCNKDFAGLAFKQVSAVRPMLPTAWFVSKCPVGHRTFRRITDRNTDPYYDRSRLVQRQRHDMRDYFLDPSDPRFRVLYPRQYEELMKKDERTGKK